MVLLSFFPNFLLAVLALHCFAALTYGQNVTRAVAKISPILGFSIKGTVNFTQPSLTSPVTVRGYIEGFPSHELRGFHIYEDGDQTIGANGSHFDVLPGVHHHGSRFDINRHTGDLGNIESNANGVAIFNFTDGIISLSGPTSILGRKLVVHSSTDVVGRDNYTNPNPNAMGTGGPVVAYGIIGIASAEGV